MKIVISPAKTLDFETPLPHSQYTKSPFLRYAKPVQAVLKRKSPQELMELMDISQNLADLNWQRNRKWKTPFTPENARPAVYAFAGDVYDGLDAYSLPADKWQAMEGKLRILSGLYGLLKPFDLIQAYRLEMGTKLPVGEAENLYHYWRPIVTAALNKELKSKELFVNLASTEYFGAVDVKALKVPVITPVFKDYKDGELKMISFFAKKARGLMVRYILDHDIETLDGLKAFGYEGYRFDENLSKERELVFTR